jgi:hypothetical protein
MLNIQLLNLSIINNLLPYDLEETYNLNILSESNSNNKKTSMNFS